jgi:hypothetical protein
MMHTTTSERDPETGFIKLYPKVEGRMINIREPIEY